jgi:hypothetical protein
MKGRGKAPKRGGDGAIQGRLAKKIRIVGQVIQIDAGKIEAHLGKILRSPLEETLNALLDAEAQHERQRQCYRLP